MLKILVAGVPNVGKTSLFYGMLSKLMSNQRECKVALSEGNQTVKHISRMIRLSMPGNDRFPKKVSGRKHIHLVFTIEKNC